MADAEVSFDINTIDNSSAELEHIGNAAEETSTKLRSVPDLKVVADVADAIVKLDELRAKADEASGNVRIKADADVALAEAKLEELKARAASSGAEGSKAASEGMATWQVWGIAIAALSPYVLAVGAAFGGLLAVGGLALEGLTGKLGGVTTAGQNFEMEVMRIHETLDHLSQASEKGLLPGLTDGLQQIKPILETLKDDITAFGQDAGAGLDFLLQVVANLAGGFLVFGNDVMKGFGSLGDPLRQFTNQMNDMFAQLDKSGDTQKLIQGLSGVIAAILQVLPTLIDTLIKVGAAMGPGLASAAQALAAVLTPLLRLMGDYPGVVAPIVDGILLWVAATKALTALGLLSYLTGAKSETAALTEAIKGLTAATKGDAEATEALDAAEAANPVGLIIAAVIALIVLLVEVVKHWGDIENAAKDVAKAIGEAFEWLGGEIEKFWDAILAPFKALGNAFSGLMSGIGDMTSIPGLASGGTVTSSGLTWVGEQGPELLNLKAASVTPLPALTAAGGSGVTNIYNISGVIGAPSAVVAAIRQAGKQSARRSGVALV